ncbi:MAG: YjbH domain-containing protein [Pseudomonadota bacterium]
MRGAKPKGFKAFGGRRVAFLVAAGVALTPPLAHAEDPEVVEEAGPLRPSYNQYGVTGLIEIPTAEVQPDTQVSFTTSFHNGFFRNTLAATILPGLEVAFRYSALRDLADPTISLGETSTLFDRSFDVRFQLVEEARNYPSVAVGLQDFLGTGLFAGEYVVATKTFLDGDLKVTGGIGWGRLASIGAFNNPLTSIADRFEDRDGDTSGGGNVNFGNYFSGEEVGVFGGLEWQSPIDGLSFKAELASDDYDFEDSLGQIDINIPANFGVEYRPLDGVELGAYYMYGSSFGVRLTLTGNPFKPLAPTENQPGPQPVLERAKSDAEIASLGRVEDLVSATGATRSFESTGITSVTIERRIDSVRWAEATLPPSADYACPTDAATAIDAEYGVIDVVTFRHAEGQTLCTVALRPAGQEAIRLTRTASQTYPTDWHANQAERTRIVENLVAELDADQLGLFGIEIQPTRIAVYIENFRYRETPRALGRTARALSRTMPPSVETFEIVAVEESLPVVSVILNRSELEAQANRPDAARRSWLTANVKDARPFTEFTDEKITESFPRFSWFINPDVPINAFDPDQPLRADLAIEAGGGIEFLPGLSLNARLSQRVIGNLDEIETESDSVLPRVRSDFADFLRDGKPALLRFTGDYVTKLDDDIYGRLSGGFFERQFGGFGGEILWKPANQSWGLGADVYYARQRTTETLFDFQDYDIVTGHASVYWDTGFYGLFGQIDAGRYLAGDYGATITVKRRFSNGWEIGGFATFTDVPFDEFGEGSFDKGLFVTIPFNWFLPIETRTEFSTTLRPLTRDGGQRLEVANRLYPTVEDFDRQALRANWGSFWD